MAVPTAQWMCLDGEIVAYEDCKVHAFSGAVKYGAGVFEGIRAYWNADDEQLYVFRLAEHMERLRYGMKVCRFTPVYETDFLIDCVIRTLKANEIREGAHIRAIAFLAGDDELPAMSPVGLVVGAVRRPSDKSVSDGIRCRISSYARISDNSLPPRIKATANYMNNRAADLEARRDGYDGVLMLTADGRLSEGAGACLFLIRDGVLVTPDRSSAILESITRDTVIKLARLYGIPVEERPVDRTEAYAAQEAFWCGSGQEVVPIVEIDRLPVGDGDVGPITRQLQEAYFDLVRGKRTEWPEWRTPVW